VPKPAKRVTVLTGVAAAAAAGTAALFLSGSPALAEDPTPSPSASSSAEPDREALRQQREDEFAAALAAELGIDKAKVAAAVEKVREAQRTEAQADRLAALKTRLDEAVKAGKLTSDQAAAILKAAEEGVLPHGGPGGGGHGRGGFPGR
jgi:hypothetical protein